jgi:hypothetical protein
MKLKQLNSRSVLSLILLAFAGAPSSRAEPNKVQYELEEHCGKAAAAIFEKDWGDKGITNTPNGQITANFENHYNQSLNKCFYLLTSTSYLTKKPPPTSIISLILINVNDNHELGEFMQDQQQATPAWCFVEAITRHSKAEWQALIKPYMEQ